MRLIRMFSLTALAGVAAMAFIGASSASAASTQLCATDTTPCTSPVTHVHQVSQKAVSFLLNPLLPVSCRALFLSTSVGPLGAPQVIKGNFTYDLCTAGCTVTEKNGPAEINVLRTATELGIVTGEGLVHVLCIGVINCNYVGEGLQGHGLGGLLVTPTTGGPGHVTFVKAPVRVEPIETGPLCPTEATLDALFISLTAEYLRS